MVVYDFMANIDIFAIFVMQQASDMSVMMNDNQNSIKKCSVTS